MWNGKGTRIAKTILKKNKVGRVSVPDFKTYVATVIKSIVAYIEEQTHRSVAQNREPRKGPTQICSTYFWQRCKNNSVKEG